MRFMVRNDLTSNLRLSGQCHNGLVGRHQNSDLGMLLAQNVPELELSCIGEEYRSRRFDCEEICQSGFVVELVWEHHLFACRC